MSDHGDAIPVSKSICCTTDEAPAEACLSAAADFGLVRETSERAHHATQDLQSSSSGATVTAALTRFGGTPFYIAPAVSVGCRVLLLRWYGHDLNLLQAVCLCTCRSCGAGARTTQ